MEYELSHYMVALRLADDRLWVGLGDVSFAVRGPVLTDLRVRLWLGGEDTPPGEGQADATVVFVEAYGRGGYTVPCRVYVAPPVWEAARRRWCCRFWSAGEQEVEVLYSAAAGDVPAPHPCPPPILSPEPLTPDALRRLLGSAGDDGAAAFDAEGGWRPRRQSE